MTVAGATLTGAVCAVVAVAALAMAVAFSRGWSPGTGKPPRPTDRRQRALEQLPLAWRERYRQLAVVAVVAGLAVWIVTGWPVHGLITAGGVLGLPFVLHPGGNAKDRIQRVEALAEWLNQLAGVHVAGLSLEQTIRSSARNAPGGVRPHVERLSARLQSNWPAEDAYRAVADELADGAVDHVVLLLQTHARDRGPGLSRALDALADSLRQQTADARAIEADRAKVRTSARWISLFVIGTVTLLMINQAYTAPYGTAQGQLLLAVLGCLFAFLLLRMQQMARPQPEPRLLAPPSGRQLADGEGRLPHDARQGGGLR